MNDPESLIDIIHAQSGKMTDKKKRILAAAIGAFSEHGYSGTSTSEIAKSAGVAEGTIFRHYPTKKELLLSIVTPVTTRLAAPALAEDLNRVLGQPYDSFETFLEALLSNRIAFVKRNITVIKILVQEVPFHEELREQFKNHVASKFYVQFKKVILHFQEKGEIRSDWPVSTVLRLAVSSLLGYVMTRYLFAPEADWSEESEIEATIQFICKGLRPDGE